MVINNDPKDSSLLSYVFFFIADVGFIAEIVVLISEKNNIRCPLYCVVRQRFCLKYKY